MEIDSLSRDELVEAFSRLNELHRQIEFHDYSCSKAPSVVFCKYCMKVYPCDTIKALRGVSEASN